MSATIPPISEYSVHQDRARALKKLFEEAGLESEQNSPEADVIVTAEHVIGETRYAILVMELAQTARARIGRGVRIKDYAAHSAKTVAKEWVKVQDVLELVELIRWSDSIRMDQQKNPHFSYLGSNVNRKNGFTVLQSLAEESLAADIEGSILAGRRKA